VPAVGVVAVWCGGRLVWWPLVWQGSTLRRRGRPLFSEVREQCWSAARPQGADRLPSLSAARPARVGRASRMNREFRHRRRWTCGIDRSRSLRRDRGGSPELRLLRPVSGRRHRTDRGRAHACFPAGTSSPFEGRFPLARSPPPRAGCRFAVVTRRGSSAQCNTAAPARVYMPFDAPCFVFWPPLYQSAADAGLPFRPTITARTGSDLRFRSSPAFAGPDSRCRVRTTTIWKGS
jgi:hypothetical protein